MRTHLQIPNSIKSLGSCSGRLTADPPVIRCRCNQKWASLHTRLWGKDVSCLFNYTSLFPLSSLVSFKENESAASSPVCWNICFNCSAGYISSLWIVSNIFWLFIFRLSLFTKMSTPLSQLKQFCLLLSFSSPFSLVAILISLCTPPVPPSVLWRSSWIWSKAHRDSHPDQRLMLSRKARSKLDVWTRLLS